MFPDLGVLTASDLSDELIKLYGDFSRAQMHTGHGSLSPFTHDVCLNIRSTNLNHDVCHPIHKLDQWCLSKHPIHELDPWCLSKHPIHQLTFTCDLVPFFGSFHCKCLSICNAIASHFFFFFCIWNYPINSVNWTPVFLHHMWTTHSLLYSS